ncbi:hypothetical protein [Stenomitos frigidus]|uniref:hypothetical protein n=1 Tax=Stenomitos frigidus TaxID=1886765 RepID=UPI0026B0B22B
MHLKENGPFEKVYIPPGTHDSGTPVGAALAICHKYTLAKGIYQVSPYIGPEYQISQHLTLVKQAGLKARFSNDVTHEVAQLMQVGS